MSLELTLSIIFAIVFAVLLFIGFLYEKELVQFEKIVFSYIRLSIKARKAGMSTEEYVKRQKLKKSVRLCKEERLIDFAA